MKTLTKIKIINWHYFWNETIDVKPIVFLTGLNGSGKSTLIDAIQLVLLGDTSGRYFNKAAMDKSDRSLKSYLRGELGDTLDGGFKYLRNGRFTSYIALEFHDELHDSYFTMGIVFDMYEDGSEEHRFFNLEDKIPQNEFIENKIPMEFKTLQKYFLDNYKDKYTFFESNRQYQDFMKKKFGGLKDKYFSLLKKATSFSPITDITTFITQYVCDPQGDIELDALQDNILEYKRLENEAKSLEERVEKLNNIKNTYSIYKQNKEDLVVSEYIVEKCQLEESKNKLVAFKNQIVEASRRINEIDLDIAEFNENLAQLDKKKIHLIQDKANNDTARLQEELEEQKKDTLSQINDINKNASLVKQNLENLLNGYISVSSTLGKNLSSFDMSVLDLDSVDELKDLNNSAIEVSDFCTSFKDNYLINLAKITKENLLELKEKISSFKKRVSSLATTIAKTISNASKKIQELRNEEANMKQGKKPYSQKLMLIKNELQSELTRKYNKEIDVNIFADLIDIKDVSWANAIEGYLYAQKFNLFVAPKYYEDAYSILKRLLQENNYYSTALVDSERLIERNYAAEIGSLADEIKTFDDGAKAYVNFLIGRLYKANSIKEARNSGNGITKECDLYRNFTLSKINPRLYQESFIGASVDQRFFDEKARQVKVNISNLEIFKKLQNIITDANNLETISSSEIENSMALLSKVGELEGLKNNLSYIETQLKEHDSTLLKSIDKRISDIEDDIASINKSKEEYLLEKGNLTKEVENLKNDKIKSEEKNIKDIETRLSSTFDPFLISEKADPLFKTELDAGKKNLEILQEYNGSLSRLQYLVSNIHSQLVKARKEYTLTYHLSYDAEKEDNDVFDDELKDFEEVKLPQYKEKIEDSYHKATKQFRDDFMFKLRSAIEDVEDQIENLNEALKQSSFGRDLYRFTVKPSQIYRRYYDMLKDDLILDNDKENEFIEKYKDVMEDLFKQIIDIGDGNKNSELMANVAKFSDYRSYLDFDLIVYNKDNGEEQRLSKMIKKKSGGETQTPFYISVLASFAQLYHVNDEGELGNTTRIIIFDEAFSKMDQGRIKEAVRLLRKFNLQVILSAPSDKVGDISQLVDETLVVLHDKNSSCVRLYAKE